LRHFLEINHWLAKMKNLMWDWLQEENWTPGWRTFLGWWLPWRCCADDKGERKKWKGKVFSL
jgi:hypothetical protein